MGKSYMTPEYRGLLSTERMLLADIQSVDTEPKDRASCARALDAILERKRIMRMQPKPKDIDVSKIQRRTRPRALPSPITPIPLEPTPPAPEPGKESL